MSQRKEFWMSMVPPEVTSQQKGLNTRGRTPRFYKKDAVKEAERQLLKHLWEHRPAELMTGPLALCTAWVWPWRLGETNTVTNHFPLKLRDTRPDHDNCIKLFQDCMARKGREYFKEDGKIATSITQTFWGEQPGIAVRIAETKDLIEMVQFLVEFARRPLWFVEHWDREEE